MVSCQAASPRSRPKFTAAALAELTGVAASSVSGIALWPRLELDEEADLVVAARGPEGEQKVAAIECHEQLPTAEPAARERVHGGYL